jgi:hypothetical protein
MPNYKNQTTQTLNVSTKDGKGDSIKSGEVKSLNLDDSKANAGLLHAGALHETKASVPASPERHPVKQVAEPAQPKT